ncbi:C40 family peptidase [Actinoplanes auranticolor]|uniref:C40 family peptidase n=1 Tax=Actinoplanes auranticolor TaxID=47988 RepID=UPI001FEA0C0A|nr:C40 family peptidase [Actinoplanes auranticolor]
MVAALAIAITGTTATAAHAEPSTSELTKKIDKASDQLEDVVESYNKMNISLKQTKAEEKKLAASLGPAKAALEAAGTQMDAIAASAYKTGNIGTMNVVLEGADNLMDRMSILEQISRSRGRDIAEYRATTENFAERQAALKATQKKQEAEAKALNARKKKIEGDLKKLYAMRTAAFGSPTEKASKYTGNIPSIAGSAGKAVTFAYNAIGVMYDYGADGPNGYDCSGLTSAAWRTAGKSLPHNAAAQYNATARISRSELKPGDLVFYRANKHVGIYVGGGQIIDASRAGQPVKKRTIDIMTPNGYGRVT